MDKLRLEKGIIIFIISCIVGILPNYGQKATPDAMGFGAVARGAYAGSDNPRILIVDDLRDASIQTGTNRGTFSWAIRQSYPRIIVFEVSGYIEGDGGFYYINNPYVSIYGQTAPNQGVCLRNKTLVIEASEVIIQHLSVRPQGDRRNRDGFSILRGRNIFIDHCSSSWATDEVMSISGNAEGNITISNCIIAEAMNFDERGKGFLAASGDHLSFIRNAFISNAERQPLVKTNSYTQVQVINNMNYNPYTHRMQFGYGNNAEIHVIGNVLKRGPSTTGADDVIGIRTTEIDFDNKFYLSDNYSSSKRGNSEWSIVSLSGMDSTDFYLARPTFTDNTLQILSHNDVESYLINYAGAFFWNRSAIDQRIINNMINGTGNSLISNIGQVGGYRELPSGERTLTIPSNPHGDSNNNGYTNIEEWVYGLGRGEEITGSTSSPIETNNRPIINSQSINIEEDASNGDVIGSVNANDIDGDNLIYSIESGNSNNIISIDSNTGEIEISNSQLLSGIEDFEVVIGVSDGSLSNTATFEFHILKTVEVNYGQGSVIQVNINANYDLGGWNELYHPNVKISDLTYVNGNTSEVDFEIWGGWTGSTGGDVTGECFPTDVIQNYVFTSDNTVRYFTFSDLDDSKLYNIDILCSRNTGATNERGAIFFVNSDSDSINAKGNTCELVTFKSVEPENGEIQIGYRKRISDSDGHVNAIILSNTDNKAGEIGSPKDNTAPIVVMHYEEAANSGTLKTLDASGSFDPDNEDLSYRWIVPDGISVSSENGSKITYLVPDVIYPEINSFILEVTDGIDTSYKSLDITFTPFNPDVSEIGVVSVKASYSDGNNHPVNLLDGNTSTYWSAEGDNQWFFVELESPAKISHLKVSFHEMEAKRSSFDVLVSEDGETWDAVYENLESCGFSSAMHLVDCSNQISSTYKYVKINGHGTDVDAQNSFSGLKVYGVSMGATSIFEEEDQQYKIYPNPASQYFNIDLPEQSTVSVYDISGKNIFERYLGQGEHYIPVDFPSGCYIISVKTENHKLSNQKLIIK